MKKKPGLEGFRIPLPKQTEQKFKDKSKYERKAKHKGSRVDSREPYSSSKLNSRSTS